MPHATTAEATFLDDAELRLAAPPRGQAIHTLPVAFSAAYFAGALATDLAYWRMPDVMWQRFSIWLIVAGLVLAGFAVIAYAIDLAGNRLVDRPAWPRVVGYAIAVALSLLNAFVHSRDGYTAVVPAGLGLSGLVIFVLLLTARVGSGLANRSSVGG
jgi:uncharacterized membrane protein